MKILARVLQNNRRRPRRGSWWKIFGVTAMLSMPAMADVCQMEIRPYLYCLSNAPTLDQQIFTQQTCPAELAQKVLALIQQQTGTIKTKHLTAALPPSSIAFTITPAEVHVAQLSTYLKQYLGLPAHLQINELRLTDGRAYLASQQPLTAYLENHNLGEKNIKLQFSPAAPSNAPSTPHTVWAVGKLQQIQKVLVAAQDIAPQDSLHARMFTLQEKAVDQPANYFTQVEQLPFFKTNKALAKNTILKRQDVGPEVLVKAAVPVAAIIQQGRLYLKNSAYPRTSGKWGDLITLEVGPAKKLVQGKVIGPQKVLLQW